MRERIENKLRAGLTPSHLELVDETQMHNVPPDSESHWKVVLVSEVFEGKSLVQRHQAVYALLGEEMRNGIHALAMKTLTPEQWQAQVGPLGNTSPPYLGGSKADR
jgi:BolA protein